MYSRFAAGVTEFLSDKSHAAGRAAHGARRAAVGEAQAAPSDAAGVATEAEGLCLTLGGSGGVISDCEVTPPVGTQVAWRVVHSRQVAAGAEAGSGTMVGDVEEIIGRVHVAGPHARGHVHESEVVEWT